MLLIEDRRFYVYAYLDPRKPGTYIYEIKGEKFCFGFEPFYIGKGHNKRILDHLRDAKNSLIKKPQKGKRINIHKFNKINRIHSLGYDVILIKVKGDLTENESFKLEENLILTIGRILNEDGPLTNISSGGDGVRGLTKEDYKEIHRKKWKTVKEILKVDPDYCKRYRQKQEDTINGDHLKKLSRKKNMSKAADKNKGILSKKCKEKFLDSEFAKKHKEATIKGSNTPEARRHNSEARKRFHKENPNFAKENAKKRLDNLKKDPLKYEAYLEWNREMARQKTNEMYLDPEKRKEQSNRMKEYYAKQKEIRLECFSIIEKYNIDIERPNNKKGIDTWIKFREELKLIIDNIENKAV